MRLSENASLKAPGPRVNRTRHMEPESTMPQAPDEKFPTDVDGDLEWLRVTS